MKYKCEFHGLYSCYHYYVRKSYDTDRKCVKVFVSNVQYFGYVVINLIFWFHFSRIYTWTAQGSPPDCDIITALHFYSIFSTLDQGCLSPHSHWIWIKILLWSYASYLNHEEKYF